MSADEKVEMDVLARIAFNERAYGLAQDGFSVNLASVKESLVRLQRACPHSDESTRKQYLIALYTAAVKLLVNNVQ